MQSPSPPPSPDQEEPGRFAYLAARTAGVADDLPFIPLKPYEHRWFQLGWRGVMLVALIAAAFSPSIGGWLWHDERLLAGDLALRSSWGLGAIWKNAFSAELSPMARTLAWLEFQLPGRDKAIVFRAVSLALHAWTCLFGWFILRRLGVPAAWLIAAVWAVHPSTLPTVAWPSRQGDLLAAAMSLTGVWAYLITRRIRPYRSERIWTDPAYHEDEDHDPRWPWVVIVLAMLIALPCGSAVPVFAVLGVAAIEWMVRGPMEKARTIALGTMLVVTIAARVTVPHGPVPVDGIRVAGTAGFAEAAAAAPWSAWHALVPLGFPFIYDRWQWGGTTWFVVLTTVTVVLIVTPLIVRRGWLLAIGLAAAFAMVHGLTVPHAAITVTAADLLPYLAGAVGVAVAICGAAALLRLDAIRPAERALRWIGGAALLLAVGAITFARAPAYVDDESVWRHAVELNPDSAAARQELAADYVEHGFVEEAGMQLDRVAEHQRGLPWFLARGRVFDAQKRYDEAVRCYESAHSQQHDDISTTTILAEAYANAGRPDRAADLYDRLLERVRDDANLYANAGLARMRVGRTHDAIDFYRTALRIDPSHIAAHVNLANALFELRQYTESAEHLQEVIRLDPRNYVAFMNAGVMLFRLGDPAKAEQMFRAAVHLEPSSPDAYRKLAATLSAQKKEAEAAWCIGQAGRLESEKASGSW